MRLAILQSQGEGSMIRRAHNLARAYFAGWALLLYGALCFLAGVWVATFIAHGLIVEMVR